MSKTKKRSTKRTKGAARAAAEELLFHDDDASFGSNPFGTEEENQEYLLDEEVFDDAVQQDQVNDEQGNESQASVPHDDDVNKTKPGTSKQNKHDAITQSLINVVVSKSSKQTSQSAIKRLTTIKGTDSILKRQFELHVHIENWRRRLQLNLPVDIDVIQAQIEELVAIDSLVTSSNIKDDDLAERMALSDQRIKEIFDLLAKSNVSQVKCSDSTKNKSKHDEDLRRRSDLRSKSATNRKSARQQAT